MNLIAVFSLTLFFYRTCVNCEPLFYVQFNGTWEQVQSLFLKGGEQVDIKCQIEGATVRGHDLLELKRQSYNGDSGKTTLVKQNGSSLCFSFTVTSGDAGVYFCCFRGQASILTLKVASQVEVKNGTVQTIFTKGDIFSKMGNHGSPKTEANLDDASMTCEVHFDESVHLGMISPTWNSPTQKSVQHNDLYFFEYWRIELLHTVGSRLTLRHQSDDQDVYGKYVCSFIFKDVGQIELDVYLKTAPILILPIIPPPPPLLETGLANPACSQNHASANLTALWHQACKIVVAYPPVSASDHAWNWSNGEATLSTIRLATDPQLIGEKLEVFESLYKQADGEQRRRGCSGLLVQQNVTTSSSHQTTAFFWCYAENEVGKTFVRWPQEYHASNLSKWPTWLLVVQVMGAAFTASALIWCFCWRYPYRRCLMFERVSRWTSHHSFVPLSHQDDCRLIMVGPTEDGSDLGNGTRPPQII